MKILGISMIISLFVGLFVFGCFVSGIGVVCLAIGITAFLYVWIIIALALIGKSSNKEPQPTNFENGGR